MKNVGPFLSLSFFFCKDLKEVGVFFFAGRFMVLGDAQFSF